MGKTKIEWTERTWNPVTGCTKISLGCRNCYAERMARRLAGRYGYPEAPHHFNVTLHSDKLGEPLKRKKPTTYFVVSMGDLFHEDVPLGYQATILDIMARTPQHTYQVLTKRPRNALKFFNWYKHPATSYKWPFDNVWLGVSAENQEWWERRRDDFFATPAALHYVSYEPALGPLVFSDDDLQRLSWLICGGESGSGARPMHPDWARSLRDQCQAVGMPYFFKQWGVWKVAESSVEVISLAEASGNRSCQIDGSPLMFWRVGKKRAGHLLDGREWREFPR